MCALCAPFQLSQLEKEIFGKLLLDNSPSKSNMTSEEWKSLQGLAEGRRQAYKVSCVVVWEKRTT